MAALRPTVACVILTKNEEINMVRCLTSVAWCAERVVVDSGSTDRTRELAENMGARFYTHIQSSAFNIAEQRNWSLASTGLASDWVLFLDADEEVTSELRNEIERNIANPGQYNAFELTPKYLFWGKWLRRTQGFPNWHARLVKSGAAGFKGGVWEHFDERAIAGRIWEPYNHYANSKGFSDWLARHDRYSSWDAERIVCYLEYGNPESLATQRKLGLRIVAARLYYLRPFVRFAHMYIFRLGFIDGIAGLVFCWQYLFYESMTVIKIWELRRVRRGDTL